MFCNGDDEHSIGELNAVRLKPAQNTYHSDVLPTLCTHIYARIGVQIRHLIIFSGWGTFGIFGRFVCLIGPFLLFLCT